MFFGELYSYGRAKQNEKYIRHLVFIYLFNIENIEITN